jgi:hypothetical protein
MSESKADRQNEEAQNPSDDSLRGQSLQDHERVKAEQDGTATHSDPSIAPLSRDEALEEVRQVRAENEERTRRHSSVAIEREVAASSPSGRSDVKPIEVSTRDSKLYLNSHGERVLDRDQIVDLQHALAAAFQAVS